MDATEWAEAWNSHIMTVPDDRARSPRDMFFFSMIEDGPRGFARPEEVEEDVGDLAGYGIDWEVAADPRLMTHLLDNNPHDWEHENPFHTGPNRLSDVPCEAPNCPLTAAQLEDLDHQLPMRVDIHTRSMTLRRVVWRHAVEICSNMF